MSRTELGRFLRARREHLAPEDVGLPAGARRRAVGLRREEVAHLVSMSVDYYARIEQGRGPQPSPDMLAVIARVLRLTVDERDHLYRLAGHNPPDRVDGAIHVQPAMLRVLDRFTDTPALILSDLVETLAQNRLAAALFGDSTAHTGKDRSGIWRWFMRPETERRVYPASDHDHQGRALAAGLRIAIGRRGPHSTAADLARDLERASPEFAAMWELQEAAIRLEDRKTLVHPEIGPIEFDCQALFTSDLSQTLMVLTTAPRSPAREQLDLLSVIGSTRFSTDR